MNCRIAIFLNFLIALGSQAFYFSNVPAVPTSRTFQVKVKASEIDFWDWKNVPLNTFTANSPLTARVRAIHQLVCGKELGDIFHVRLGHDDKFDFWEGQSCGILPPGTDVKTGKLHWNRLYSFACSRSGENRKGDEFSLCVRRVRCINSETGEEDELKKGICSNFLSSVRIGDEVRVTGPFGKMLLLPSIDPKKLTNLIFVSTGTGIAPFRSLLHQLFLESNPTSLRFSGKVTLFAGFRNKAAALYESEWGKVKLLFNDRFEYVPAYSREETAITREKSYVQHKLRERIEDILFQMLEGEAHIYFCGLRGMMPEIIEVFQKEALRKGLHWEHLIRLWKEERRWHVEVY